MPNFVYDRLIAGEPMPGVFLVSNRMPKGQAVDELFWAVHCLSAEDCMDQVKYFRDSSLDTTAGPPSPLTLSPKGARAISYPWGTANREDAVCQSGQALALAPFGERVGVRGQTPAERGFAPPNQGGVQRGVSYFPL